MTHTHTGYTRTVGRGHDGNAYTHSNARGVTNALNGGSNIYSGATYQALCGETVRANDDGYGSNVAAAAEGRAVTCRRRRRAIDAHSAAAIATASAPAAKASQ